MLMVLMVACNDIVGDKAEVTLCFQVQGFDKDVFEQRLYPANRPDPSCGELAAGLAFADGYAQALDRFWRNHFFALNRSADAQLPPIADPIVGAHARALSKCDDNPLAFKLEIDQMRAAVLDRVQAHLSVCNKGD